MEREVGDLRPALRARQSQPPARILVSGVGSQQARNGLSEFLDGPERPDYVLAIGFAGALRDELRTGALVLSRRLHCSGEEASLAVDPRLLELAQEALQGPSMPPYYVADSVTVPRMVHSAAGKRRLADATNAWVANMEDYWIGKAALQRGIPFVSVRAVLDTFDQELPPFVASTGDKSTLGQMVHVMTNLVLRPWDLPKVVTLSKQVTVAQRSLAASGLALVSGLRSSHIWDSPDGPDVNELTPSLSLSGKGGEDGDGV